MLAPTKATPAWRMPWLPMVRSSADARNQAAANDLPASTTASTATSATTSTAPNGPETLVPDEALAAALDDDGDFGPDLNGLDLTPAMQSLLTGALRIGELRGREQGITEGYRDGYEDGVKGEFLAGVTCGTLIGAVLVGCALAISQWQGSLADMWP